MKSPPANKSIHICVKCRSCGLPWNRKLQRKKGKEQFQTKRTHLHLQICSIVIQSYVRRYLIQRHRRNNDPIEQWNTRCVHYLSAKGPYGARVHNPAYVQRIIYTAAAIEIQTVWRLHRSLKHLQHLSSSTKELNATENAQHTRRRIGNRRRTTTTTLRPTPRKSVAEIKRDKIRKMSQKKWKWFYDKQDSCENNSVVSRRQPELDVDDVSSDVDVMSWLTNLDLDGCCNDDIIPPTSP